MYTVFEAIVLKMTVMTFLVIALKLLFKNKLTAKMHCMIWLLPCIQLLFCISDIQLQSATSIYNAIPYTAPAEGGIDLKPTVTAIWLTGVVIFALWHIITYILYLHKIRSLPYADDAGTMKRLKKICIMLDIPHRRRVILRTGKTAQTVFNTIIIPDNFSDYEEYHILLHELCHFRYYDNLKLWTALGVLCINWFNPVIWLAFRLFRTDIEMLCDERVLQIAINRREYAEVLIKSSAIRPRYIPGAVSANNGKREVFARIRRIVRFNRMKPVWLIGAVAGCIGISILCLTAPKNTPENFAEAIPSPSPQIYAADTEPTITAAPAIVAAHTTEPVATSSPTTPPAVRTAQTNTQRKQSTPSSSAVPASPASTAPPSANSTATRSKQIAQSATDTESNSYISDAIRNSNTAINNSANTSGAANNNIGTPESISGNGSKETYRLDDGSRAVVQYNDGEIQNRYIIVE